MMAFPFNRSLDFFWQILYLDFLSPTNEKDLSCNFLFVMTLTNFGYQVYAGFMKCIGNSFIFFVLFSGKVYVKFNSFFLKC